MESSSPLDLSVVIATWNRERSLERLLDELARQDIAGLTHEIIVVDNASTDGTGALLRRESSRLPLVALHEPRPGKNRALNRALEVARGRLIVFTDDDTIPVQTWLREYHEAARRRPEDSVFAGPIDPLFPPGTPPRLADPSYPFAPVAFSRYRPADEERLVDQMPFGPNYAVRASLLASMRFREDIGPSGKDYPMGSETELLFRLKQQGHQTVYLPTAGVAHVIEPHQVTLSWLMGRGFRAGRGGVLILPDRQSTRWFGVPRYVWKRFLIAGSLCATCRLFRLPWRWEACVDFQKQRGAVYEYRRQLAGR